MKYTSESFIHGGDQPQSWADAILSSRTFYTRADGGGRTFRVSGSDGISVNEINIATGSAAGSTSGGTTVRGGTMRSESWNAADASGWGATTQYPDDPDVVNSGGGQGSSSSMFHVTSGATKTGRTTEIDGETSTTSSTASSARVTTGRIANSVGNSIGNRTSQYTYTERRTVCGTYSTTTLIGGNTESTWQWNNSSTISSTHSRVAQGNTYVAGTYQVLSSVTGDIASYSVRKYNIRPRYKSSYYLSADETAWTLKERAYFNNLKIGYISQFMQGVGGSSFILRDSEPTLTRNTIYRIDQGAALERDTDVTLTSIYHYNTHIPSYRTGNPGNITERAHGRVDIVQHRINTNGDIERYTGQKFILDQRIIQTYFPWYGSVAVTTRQQVDVMYTYTVFFSSYARLGTKRAYAGLVTRTNESVSREYTTFRYTSWANSWTGAYSTGSGSFSTSTSAWGGDETGSGSGSNSFENGLIGRTDYEVLTPAFSTGLVGGEITVMTPAKPYGYIGFGGEAGAQNNDVYGFITIASAGDTFWSGHELDYTDVSSLAKTVALYGGDLIATDACNLPNNTPIATYKWSVPNITANFSTASTLLATYSSTTNTNGANGVTSTVTYRHATYTLGVAGLITGDFFLPYRPARGTPYVATIGGQTTMQLGNDNQLVSRRTILFPAGAFTVHTNRDAEFVGSNSFSYSSSVNPSVVPHGDELYIVQEDIMSVSATYVRGRGYDSVSVVATRPFTYDGEYD